MTDYDKLYAECPNALGAPTPEVAALWDMLPPAPLTVLDVGCGQGRDALPLAERGHTIIAIDPSPAGIAQLDATAATRSLPITAIVADAASFTPDHPIDLLLIDRTLHMILDDDQRTAALRHLLAFLAPGGWVLIADEPSNMAGLRATLSERPNSWRKHHDSRPMLLWEAT